MMNDDLISPHGMSVPASNLESLDGGELQYLGCHVPEGCPYVVWSVLLLGHTNNMEPLQLKAGPTIISG